MSHLYSGHGLPLSCHISAWVTVSPTPRLTLNITNASAPSYGLPYRQSGMIHAVPKSHIGSCRLRPPIFLSHLSLGHGLQPTHPQGGLIQCPL